MRRFLFILIINTIFFQAQSNHIAGADIGWECLGNDSLKINLTIYRDCNGSPSSRPLVIAYSKCISKKIVFNQAPIVTDILPVCQSQCTRCDSRGCTFQFGVQKEVYSKSFYYGDLLKNGCDSINLTFNECCRTTNSTVTGTTFFISSTIILRNLACFNSPKWNSDPIFVSKLGSDVTLNLGAYTSSFDSIRYAFDSAMTFDYSGVTYNGSYTYQKPIYYLGFPNLYNESYLPRGLHLNPITGNLTFRVMKVEKSIIKTKGTLYKNGKQVGVIKREFNMAVVKSIYNQGPKISGLDGSGQKSSSNFLTNICYGDTLDYFVVINDPDTFPDSINTVYTINLPNYSINKVSSGFKLDTLFITIIVDSNYKPNTNYSLNINSEDNTCPIKNSAQRHFLFQFKPTKDSITWSDFNNWYLGCNKYQVQLKNKSLPYSKFSWQLNGLSFNKSSNLYFNVPDSPSTSILTGRILNCASMLSKKYSYKQPQTINLGADFSICKKANNPEIIPSPNGGTWKDNIVTKNHFLKLDQLDTGLHYAVYSFKDSIGCDLKDSIGISVLDYDAKINMPPNKTYCNYDAADTIKASPKGIWINADSLLSEFIISPKQLGAGNYKYYYSVTDSLGCTNIDTLAITLHNAPIAKFNLTKEKYELFDTVVILNNSQGNNGLKYFWNIGLNEKFDSVENPVFVFDTAAIKDIQLLVIDTISGCADTLFAKDIIERQFVTAFKKETQFCMYPNPTTGVLNINSNLGESFSIEITDITGKLLLQIENQGPKAQIDMSHFAPSFYQVRIQNDKRLEVFLIKTL